LEQRTGSPGRVIKDYKRLTGRRAEGQRHRVQNTHTPEADQEEALVKTLARRLRRLEDHMGLVELTAAEKEACERGLAGMVRGIRSCAASLGRDLTPEEQQRIAELERPLDARTMRVPVTIEAVSEALERGRQRAASSVSESAELAGDITYY